MKHENPWDNTSAIGAYPLLLIAALMLCIITTSWLFEKAAKALDDVFDYLWAFIRGDHPQEQEQHEMIADQAGNPIAVGDYVVAVGAASQLKRERTRLYTWQVMAVDCKVQGLKLSRPHKGRAGWSTVHRHEDSVHKTTPPCWRIEH